MSVAEVPISAALESIGGEIDGIETAGILMLARQYLQA
jgi:hypothetical protein